MSDAQQFQHARCHVGEFKDASSLVDCRRLKANQRSEARAIQMFYIAKVDNDATAEKDEGPHHFFYLTRGVTDQLAMTLDCRHSIPVFVFMFRFKFTVERTISCHSSAVSFRESTDRLTAAYRATSSIPRFYTTFAAILRLRHAWQAASGLLPPHVDSTVPSASLAFSSRRALHRAVNFRFSTRTDRTHSHQLLRTGRPWSRSETAIYRHPSSGPAPTSQPSLTCPFRPRKICH